MKLRPAESLYAEVALSACSGVIDSENGVAIIVQNGNDVAVGEVSPITNIKFVIVRALDHAIR